MPSNISTYNIASEDNTRHVFGLTFENVERVNPRDYIVQAATLFAAELQFNIIKTVEPELLLDSINVIRENTLKHVCDQMHELTTMSDKPNEFIDLLASDLKKSDQIKLIKNTTLTKKQLACLMLEAGKMGYTYSQYRIDVMPKNVVNEDMPNVASLDENGEVSTIGKTNMSQGQLKAAIEQRKYEVIKVFDKGEVWHCFYFTGKGMQGKESGVQGSKPHIHYLSSAFGITREDLYNAVKNGRMPTSPVHIGVFD